MRVLCTLCLWIASEVGWPSPRFLTTSRMNYSQRGREGHHFEMWPGQQITFCFGSVVKVNVSQVRTRVMYSWLSQFCWLNDQTNSLYLESKEKKVKGVRIVKSEMIHPSCFSSLTTKQQFHFQSIRYCIISLVRVTVDSNGLFNWVSEQQHGPSIYYINQ